MLPIDNIFNLGRLSNGNKEDTYMRVVNKGGVGGLTVGTPFITSKELYEGYKAQVTDFNVLMLNPCPVSPAVDSPLLITVSNNMLGISEEQTFLHSHEVVEIKTTEQLDGPVNKALNGGSSTIFIADKDLMSSVLFGFIPELLSNYKYSGILSNIGKLAMANEQPVLMLQLYHPKHCCAIYYPDKVAGLLLSVSMVPIGKALEHGGLSPLRTITMFVSEYLENIIEVDGTQVTYFSEFDNNLFESLYAMTIKPGKKKPVIKREASNQESIRIHSITELLHRCKGLEMDQAQLERHVRQFKKYGDINKSTVDSLLKMLQNDYKVPRYIPRTGNMRDVRSNGTVVRTSKPITATDIVEEGSDSIATSSNLDYRELDIIFNTRIEAVNPVKQNQESEIEERFHEFKRKRVDVDEAQYRINKPKRKRRG